MALLRRSPSLRFLCFVASMGNGRKEVSNDYQCRKDFFAKILGEMQLRFHLGQTNKRNEPGGEWSQGVSSSLSVPAEPSIAPPSTSEPPPLRYQARPGAMLDRGTRTKDRPKSAKFNDQKECFVLIICSAMPSRYVIIQSKGRTQSQGKERQGIHMKGNGQQTRDIRHVGPHPQCLPSGRCRSL